MHLSTRHFATIAVLSAVIFPALARDKNEVAIDKSATYARMLELQREIDASSAAGARDVQLTDLTNELERLSAALGGDRVPGARDRASATPSAVAPLVAPTSCGFPQSTGSFAGTPGNIGTGSPSNGLATFTAGVAGAGAYLWDVNLNTTIVHTFNGDLDITLTSPAGTVVAITTDNAAGSDNVFNGTTWDDNVNFPVTDKVFTNNTTATPLSPEGRLQAFRGENPNGVWTLTITDQAGADFGSVLGWSLDISTLAAPPVTTTLPFPKVTGLAVGPGVATTTDTLIVGGLGTYLMETELSITVAHANSAELDISLASPGGPAVIVTTDNGGTSDNVFNGSLFDTDAPIPVTDAMYVNNTTATPLSPEGAPDNWLGQDPNGTWTLTVVDDTASNGGTLVEWTVTATTIPAPTPSAPVNYAGTTGPIPDASDGTEGTYFYTATVLGLPGYLWDVDLNTLLEHTFAGDLDVTLTSPAGSVVVITTDNGGSNEQVFNGTLWDDNVNAPVTDFVFTTLVTATPLSPEGRLSAFRGENPNGTWTLKIVDDLTGDFGNLPSWSLDIAALSAAPPLLSTTVSQTPALPITDAATVSDMLAVTTPGTAIVEVELTMEIAHTENADLDITLTSPGGTVVKVTTDNGGTFDNVFNGSLFDCDLDGALTPVTDATYANLVAETPITPEGSFDNFAGQNPNGIWTLTITDDLATDVGTLNSWSLTVRTCGNPPPVAYCFGDGSGTACPCLPVPLVGDPDKGCPNSFNAGGGKLTASGIASISADTLVMTCTTINNGGAVVFQGTNNNGGGLGTAFGDGLRCAAGTVRRMRSHQVTTNSHQYPDPMFGDNAISIRGAVLAAGDRWYQGWYRSGLAHCNPTQNYNLTNGVKVTWVP